MYCCIDMVCWCILVFRRGRKEGEEEGATEEQRRKKEKERRKQEVEEEKRGEEVQRQHTWEAAAASQWRRGSTEECDIIHNCIHKPYFSFLMLKWIGAHHFLFGLLF